MAVVTWGDFEVDLDHVVGEGKSGRVFAARQLSTNQLAAIQTLATDSPDQDARFLQRFQPRVHALARVRDSRILSILQVGQNDGTLWYATARIEGKTLRERLNQGRVPEKDAVRIAIETAQALASANRCDIQHGDLRPENLLLCEDGSIKLTGWESTVGTTRSDLFDLGCLFYEMITECPPYAADDLSGTPPVSPRILVSDLGPAVERVIMRCLEQDPDRRYADYQALQHDLEGRNPVPPGRPAKIIWAAGGIGTVLLLTAVWASYSLRSRPEPPAPDDGTSRETTSATGRDPESKKEPILSNEPSDQDLRDLSAALRLAERNRNHFLARDYEPFLTALGNSKPSRPYVKRHVDAFGEIGRLAESVVEARLGELCTVGKRVNLQTTTSSGVSGTVRGFDKSSVFLVGDNTEIRVSFVDLHPSEFLGEDIPWKARLAFRCLSYRPSEALRELLPLPSESEDFIPWLPLLIRMTREEARARVRQGAFEQARVVMDRLADAEHRAVRAAKLYPESVASDFARNRRERAALKLFLEGSNPDVLVRFPETAVCDPAARQILERLGERLLRNKSLAKAMSGRVDPELDLRIVEECRGTAPRVRDLAGRSERPNWNVDPSPQQDADWDHRKRAGSSPAYAVLRSLDGTRRLEYLSALAPAREAVLLCYRFFPGSTDSSLRVSLGKQRWLRFDGDELILARDDSRATPREKGKPIAGVRSPKEWRTLALIRVVAGDQSVILCYRDGDPIPALRVRSEDARLPLFPRLEVTDGVVYFKNILIADSGPKEE